MSETPDPDAARETAHSTCVAFTKCAFGVVDGVGHSTMCDRLTQFGTNDLRAARADEREALEDRERESWLLARIVDDWCHDQFCYGRPLERDGKPISHTKLNDMWAAAKALIPPEAQRERTQQRLEEATAILRARGQQEADDGE